MKDLLKSLVEDMHRLHARIEELEHKFCRPTGNPSIGGSAHTPHPQFDMQAFFIRSMNPK